MQAWSARKLPDAVSRCRCCVDEQRLLATTALPVLLSAGETLLFLTSYVALKACDLELVGMEQPCSHLILPSSDTTGYI